MHFSPCTANGHRAVTSSRAPSSRMSRGDAHAVLARVSLALLVALGATRAGAAEMCVANNAQLATAIILGQSQQSDYTIKIVQGTYTLGSTNETLSAPTTIEGGYTANCAARSVNAANTTINLGGSGFLLTQLTGSPSALIAIDGVSLVNVGALNLFSGQYHTIAANDPGAVRVSRSRLSGVTGSSNRFLLETFGSGETVLENVLLDHLPAADTSHCGIDFVPRDGGPVRLTGLTADLGGNIALCFDTDTSVTNIYDSIIWSTDGTPAPITAVSSGVTINIVNSLYRNTTGSPTGQVISALHVDPQWNNAALNDYHLKSTSPAVNSGTPIVPGGLPATDIQGAKRWVGSMPDRGAYESLFNDATNYTVTTTADSGAGSLRDAITQANSLPNPATISFAIAGACPRVIALSSMLPDIISPMVIDATTQPGSTKNSAPDAFNATLCVVVKSNSFLAHGFYVPVTASAASLTVRGLGIGGFSEAVLLEGGSNHVIAGNQFGGSVGSFTLPSVTQTDVIIDNNATGGLIVGGSSLADRNVIGDANGVGIATNTSGSSAATCQIVNNLIGVAPNGNTALANGTGIKLNGDGCAIVGNRIVGNSQDAIWIGGGHGNVIQRNQIGVTVNGSGLINNGAGVRISSGFDNVIGAGATSGVTGTVLANTIRFMVAGGVVANGGGNNSIRSNLIYDNGLSGAALDIDLNADGPTPNDADDVDTGANTLQNFPWTDLIVHPADDANPLDFVLNAHLNTFPGSYRIDAYFSNRCDNGAFHVTGRGHADAFVGTRLVTVPTRLCEAP